MAGSGTTKISGWFTPTSSKNEASRSGPSSFGFNASLLILPTLIPDDKNWRQGNDPCGKRFKRNGSVLSRAF